jgi:hypothetical protein
VELVFMELPDRPSHCQADIILDNQYKG